MNNKAVILLSGGLDSATALAVAKQQGLDCYALSFNYGQRHQIELQAAHQIARHLCVVEHKVLRLDLAGITGSALTDPSVPVPTQSSQGIPVTYVPARNTVFLALALGWAEGLKAYKIFIGVNAVDYSGYPDCRPEFIAAFEATANLATKVGVEDHPFHIDTPLINLTKGEIIKLGTSLGVDYALTISCYDPDIKGRACGICDSCRLRADGFKQAGLNDPTRYQTNK